MAKPKIKLPGGPRKVAKVGIKRTGRANKAKQVLSEAEGTPGGIPDIYDMLALLSEAIIELQGRK